MPELPDVDDYLREHKFGSDALNLYKSELCARIPEHRENIKTTLINPKRLADIGNGFADDSLFQIEVCDAEPALHLDKDSPHPSSG